MNYALADLHNDFSKFDEMLGRIRFDRFKDHLYIVGDLFDRGNYAPDPFGIIYKVTFKRKTGRTGYGYSGQ